MNEIIEWRDGDEEGEGIMAVFGSVERGGQWSVPRHLRARAILGAVVLDLRRATFEPGVTELEVLAVLGDVTILVPPRMAVQSEGAAILGCFEHRDPARFESDGPVLRIRGQATLANVEIG